MQVPQEICERREKLRQKLRGELDLSILGGDYPGIEMNGLLKGLQLEASVSVKVVPKVSLLAASLEPSTIGRGKAVTITYEIEYSQDIPDEIWLGASFRDANNKLFFNTIEDKAVALMKGKKNYQREFTIAKDAPLGEQMLATSHCIRQSELRPQF